MLIRNQRGTRCWSEIKEERGVDVLIDDDYYFDVDVHVDVNVHIDVDIDVFDDDADDDNGDDDDDDDKEKEEEIMNYLFNTTFDRFIKQ